MGRESLTNCQKCEYHKGLKDNDKFIICNYGKKDDGIWNNAGDYLISEDKSGKHINCPKK